MHRKLKMPYCGGKLQIPRGRALATREEQCVRQIRTFGRRVVRNEDATRTLDNARWGSGQNCGKRNPLSVQGNCARQFRLYGLLPIIESESDLRRRTFVARTKEEHTRFPRVQFHPPHPYTQNRYEGNIQRGATSVFCSVVWSLAEDVAVMNPQGLPDGVGFGFGYFLPRLTRGNVITFNIVHVNVNPPYRRGSSTAATGSSISSYVVREFVKGITQRARSIKCRSIQMRHVSSWETHNTCRRDVRTHSKLCTRELALPSCLCRSRVQHVAKWR